MRDNIFGQNFVLYKARFITCRCDTSFVMWYFLQRCLSFFIVVCVSELITDSWLFKICLWFVCLKEFYEKCGKGIFIAKSLLDNF